jgi:3-(3-hydroxy-phenyl)propionate hydroxylase
LLLLVFGELDASSLRRVRALADAAPMVAVQVLGRREMARAIEHVRDPEGHMKGACHVFGHAWALVRPDAYVAATGEAIDASVVDAVGRCLGAEEAKA